MGKGIVLGRFQPFHNGHAYLVEQALNQFEEVTIAIGSSQDEWTVDNPFSFKERKDMIQQWIGSCEHQSKVSIVGIEDINDPPNWVEHASKHHGRQAAASLMAGFDSARLPIMSTLAKEFAVFDRFFASHP